MNKAAAKQLADNVMPLKGLKHSLKPPPADFHSSIQLLRLTAIDRPVLRESVFPIKTY